MSETSARARRRAFWFGSFARNGLIERRPLSMLANGAPPGVAFGAAGMAGGADARAAGDGAPAARASTAEAIGGVGAGGRGPASGGRTTGGAVTPGRGAGAGTGCPKARGAATG